MSRQKSGRRGLLRSLPGIVTALLITLAPAPLLHGQPSCDRIMVQDPALNNLVDPPGYKTARPGALGEVLRAGTGARAMILIPGLGFGGSVFNEFMEGLAGQYRWSP